jgi:uncharacterized protein YndB with AHSA1/START domain
MNMTDLNLSRTIRATPEEIYDVWLDAKSPGGPWFGTKRTILNAVVDGLFYHVVEHAGKTWPHYGRFITLERGKKIEHTWVSPATKGLETTVTLTFARAEGGTKVELHHSGVPDDEMGRQHGDGWTYILGSIAGRLERAK